MYVRVGYVLQALDGEQAVVSQLEMAQGATIMDGSMEGVEKVALATLDGGVTVVDADRVCARHFTVVAKISPDWDSASQ